jgi:type IV pilus assembly protein PilB
MRLARLDHTFYEREPHSRLGALLLAAGLVTNEDLDWALENREPGELIGEALVRLQICFEDEIARFLAKQAGLEFLDIRVTSVDRRAVKLLTPEQARQLRAIPARLHSNGEVSIAVADPTDDTLLAKLKLATGHDIRLYVTTPSSLRTAWAAAYGI